MNTLPDSNKQEYSNENFDKTVEGVVDIVFNEDSFISPAIGNYGEHYFSEYDSDFVKGSNFPPTQANNVLTYQDIFNNNTNFIENKSVPYNNLAFYETDEKSSKAADVSHFSHFTNLTNSNNSYNQYCIPDDDFNFPPSKKQFSHQVNNYPSLRGQDMSYRNQMPYYPDRNVRKMDIINNQHFLDPYRKRPSQNSQPEYQSNNFGRVNMGGHFNNKASYSNNQYGILLLKVSNLYR